MKVGQLGIGESRMILAHGAGCNGEARVTVRGPCLGVGNHSSRAAKIVTLMILPAPSNR